ncbi:MAG: rna polymerase rpb7-like domain-containing [Lasallia pustulata]|uniref:DNA-directed RNA polymerase subunit n=1 Tax=Lasallia pustulata TaxID=136370 RepID=A0A5M8Q2Y7_9LECA|nr:MAG: rna polymerase rpb7-like domain-containing [Lasallia pustulata]
MEGESPLGRTQKSHRESGDKAERKGEKKRKREIQEGTGKGEKKRKREIQEDTGLSPSKRHHPEKNPGSSAAQNDLAEVSGSANDSPFHLQTSSLYLALSPIAQLHPLQGLCAEHLSPLILTYYPPFHGVVLSYSNVRLSEDLRRPGASGPGEKVLAKSIDEYAVSFVWVTADFIVFEPQRRGWIEGWINLQNEGHLGLVCWNLFNASIDRSRLPREWKWIAGGMGGRRKSSLKKRGMGPEIEDMEHRHEANDVEEVDGHFEDSEGQKIEGKVRFRVRDVVPSSTSEPEKGFLSIEGTMLGDDEEEEDLVEQDKGKVRRKGRVPLQRRTQVGHTMAGALGNGQFDGVRADDGDRSWSAKHRSTH